MPVNINDVVTDYAERGMWVALAHPEGEEDICLFIDKLNFDFKIPLFSFIKLPGFMQLILPMFFSGSDDEHSKLFHDFLAYLEKSHNTEEKEWFEKSALLFKISFSGN